MKVGKPYFEIEDRIDGMEILKKIEKAGRTCYKSEERITDDSCKAFVKRLIESEIRMNLREWRHFFNLRTSRAAHPQMREIAIPLLEEFKRRIPVVFDDISPE